MALPIAGNTKAIIINLTILECKLYRIWLYIAYTH